MAFHETPRFPNKIARNMTGGPVGRTQIVPLNSGHEERNSPWSQFRHEYNVSKGVRCQQHMDEVKTYFLARHGRLHGFRLKDFADFKSCAAGGTIADTDQQIGVGDDSTTAFQLVKVYTSGSQTYSRTITKPVSGTVVVALDGSPQASGWSVDTTTGIVTFDSAPGAAVVITAGFEFDVPVRFDTDRLPTELVDNAGSIGTLADIPLIEVRV